MKKLFTDIIIPIVLSMIACILVNIVMLHAEEQPPYRIKDNPAINTNFDVIYQLQDKHVHDGIDSSKLGNACPKEDGYYNLGSPSNPWNYLYVSSIVYVYISTRNPFPPDVEGFIVRLTSVPIYLKPNSQDSGTIQVTVTTSAFETSTSSTGVFGLGTTTITIASLTPNTNYQFKARSAINSKNSSEIAIASTWTIPASPTNLNWIEVWNTSITINWQTNGNPLIPATSYQVQISTTEFYGETQTSSTTFILQVTTTGLSESTTYYFRAYAFGVGGSSSVYSVTFATKTKSSNAIVTRQLTAWYTFDGDTNNHYGAAPNWGQAGTFTYASSLTSGMTGQSIVVSYATILTMNDSAIQPTGHFTIDVWIYPTITQQDNWGILSFSHSSADTIYTHCVGKTNFTFSVNDSGSVASVNYAIGNNALSHLQIVADGSYLYLVVNGILRDKQACSYSSLSYGSTQNYFALGPTNYYEGKLQSLKIYFDDLTGLAGKSVGDAVAGELKTNHDVEKDL